MASELKWDHETAVCRRNSFTVEDYAIGILLQLSPGLECIRISHPEKGELLISPERGEYIARISDAAGFFQAHKSAFSVTELKGEFPHAAVSGCMEDLLWEAALHAAQGRLVDGLRKHDVVQFSRWPNLTRVSITPNVMRICALLTRFPTGISLGRNMLRIEEDEMYSVCSAAKVVGIVNVLSRNVQLDTAEEALVAARRQAVDESKSGRFFGRLFAKLSGL